jgi:catechol 2,3-dioxygenase-like lactoylglutathione lyase family enzyme
LNDVKETTMDERLNLITLGVRDVSRARTFYEALGWRLDGGVDDESDHVAFQTPGLIVARGTRGKLAADSGVEDGGGWGRRDAGYNVRSPRRGRRKQFGITYEEISKHDLEQLLPTDIVADLDAVTVDDMV